MTKKKLNLIDGNILESLVKLSWPIVVGMLFQTGFNIVDTIFVGRLGDEALAAMTVAFPVIIFFIALAGGTAIGVNSLIARKLGAGKKREADNVAEHGLFLSLILYIFFLVSGLTFSKPLFSLLGAEEAVLVKVLEYSNIFFIGSIFIFIMFICNNILRAEGNTKTPMIVLSLSATLNIILDPILIFGFGPIPAMGIRGAALATVIARTIGSFIVFDYLVIRKKSELKFNLKDFKFRWEIIRKIYAVGFPASLSQMVMSIGLFFFNTIFAVFGTSALAAFGLYFRLESLAILPLIGLRNGVITMTGQNYGAKKYQRIDKIVIVATKIAMSFMITIALLFMLFPNFWLRIFTDDPGVLEAGFYFLRIVPGSLFLIGPAFMINGAFQGIGKGFFPLIFHATRTFFMTVPLAYFLGIYFGFGLPGSLWAFVISSVVMSVFAVLWYCFGPWRKKSFSDSADSD